MNDAIAKLVARLEAIARKNDDRFEYKIVVTPVRGGVQFRFICYELPDRHEMFTGCGNTVEEAVAGADSEVADVCKEWGYTE
jgi:hypothetical protein